MLNCHVRRHTLYFRGVVISTPKHYETGITSSIPIKKAALNLSLEIKITKTLESGEY